MLILVAIAMLLPSLSFAATASWDAVVDPDLQGYNLYRAPGACATPGAFAKVNTYGLVTLEETDGTANWPGLLMNRLVAATGTYNTSVTVAGTTPANTADWVADFYENAALGVPVAWIKV